MNSNNKNVLIGAVVIVVVLLGVFWYISHNSGTGGVNLPGNQNATSSTETSSQSNSSGTGATKSGTTVTTHTTTGTGTTAHPIVAPRIIQFLPSTATPETVVTIRGTNFDSTTNYISFGTSQGRHHTDGTADNVIATVGSKDGTTLTFTVPSSGPSGLLCDAQNHCTAISAVRTVPGNYPVTVRTAAGTSNSMNITVSTY